MNADLATYPARSRLDMRVEIESHLSKTPRPFYREEVNFAEAVAFHAQRIPEIEAEFVAFSDKRTSAAKSKKQLLIQQCVALYFFRIYAAAA